MIERWRTIPIPDFDCYSVSNCGDVRRDRRTKRGKGIVGKILSATKGWYPHVVLWGHSGTKTTFKIHTLVALTFLTKPSPNHIVNHKDGNKRNNQVDNLEWCTPAENRAHAVKLGLYASGERHSSRTHPESVPKGEDHWSRRHPEKVLRGATNGNAKLTEKQVKQIRKLLSEGMLQRDIASLFGMTQTLISRINLGRLWSHIP